MEEVLVPERVAGAPQVQESWSSKGPGGKQVEIILRVIATIKNKGVTRDHVVFSFVSRRLQPLQHRQHPAFRYEGTSDATRMSPEPMAESEAIMRCCKVLDNFDKSLKLPTLFCAKNPPENAWVSIGKYCRVLLDKVFSLLIDLCFLRRKITRRGIVCLQLPLMLPLMIAKSGKQLQDLCCRERILVSMLASKNLIFFCLHPVCLSFLF